MIVARPDFINRGRVRSALAIGGLAVSLGIAASVVPAQAATKSALLAQAKRQMQRANAAAEVHKTIPFKPGTNFTVNCGFHSQNVILCTEHAGPEQCVKGKPWSLISDQFPIIKGRVGRSTNYILTVTSHYCTTSS